MGYKIKDGIGDSIAVPQIVFAKLSQLEDDWLRVALFVLSTGNTEPSQISRELRLKSTERAREALVFWKGAGLLCDDSSSAACLDNVNMASEPSPRLTTHEVTAAAQTDSNISGLVQECQAIMGGVITQNDTNEFVSLYLNDEMPLDMILLGAAHFVSLGKRSGKYIARALRSWQAQGIDSGEAAEKYLHSLETRVANEKLVAEVFKMQDAKFTRAESNIINEWFLGFGYGTEMISEALGYAGENKTVRYVNGILRAWYSKGFKTVRDVQAQSAMTMQNLQPQGKAPVRDILQNALGKVPVYKPREEVPK
ncbi:MAG: DnaD domain protein [Oscillospiraceae bacterium]